jgi:hypothetical protein
MEGTAQYPYHKYELDKAHVIVMALDKINNEFTDQEKRELIEKFMYIMADYSDIESDDTN